MKKTEFEKFYNATAKKVNEKKNEGMNYCEIKDWLIGWIGACIDSSFTGAQIGKLFDLSYRNTSK